MIQADEDPAFCQVPAVGLQAPFVNPLPQTPCKNHVWIRPATFTWRGKYTDVMPMQSIHSMASSSRLSDLGRHLYPGPANYQSGMVSLWPWQTQNLPHTHWTANWSNLNQWRPWNRRSRSHLRQCHSEPWRLTVISYPQMSRQLTSVKVQSSDPRRLKRCGFAPLRTANVTSTRM